MARTRPTVLTVMGILNIVFGSLTMVCMVCSGGALLMLFNSDILRLPNGINPMTDMWEFLKREVPGYLPITVSHLVLGFILGVLLLIAGIGLLHMRRWARGVSIVYSIVDILLGVGNLIFTLAFVNPATARWPQDFIRRHGMGLPPGMGLEGNSSFNNIASIAGAFIGMAYAVVLLIMMLTPTVAAAFGGREAVSDYEAGGAADEVDDDYDRRPRRDGWND